MDVDTYRRTIRIIDPATQQPLNFSAIDAGPRHAERTIVFIHGFGGRAAYWEHQIEHFSIDARVVALDLRGHGLSDAPFTHYNVEELCQDVVQILHELGVPENFILISHSFGGALSSYFINKFPNRVEKFVIIASASQFKLRWAGRFLLSLPPGVLRVARQFVRMTKMYPPSHVVVNLNRNALSIWNGKPYLQQIKIPSLVILGEKDLLFAQESYREVAEQIPNAQEVIIPVSAHQVMVERPQAVNRAIDRFLGKAYSDASRSITRDAERKLEAERPWLKYFDPRSPYIIKPPIQPVQRMMEIAAMRYSETAALIFHGQEMSYKRLNRHANRFAQALIADGLKKGDRVGLLLPNTPQAMVSYYGVLKAGGVVVFLNPLFTPEDLRYQLEHSEVSVVVAMSLFAKTLGKALGIAVEDAVPRANTVGHIRRIIFTAYGDYLKKIEGIKFNAWDMWREGHIIPLKLWNAMRPMAQNWGLFMLTGNANTPEPPPVPQDLAVIQYTSGTTGSKPQGVMLSHANLASNALQMRHWLAEARPAEERILAVLPFAHSYGLTSCLNFAPLVAGTLILLPSFAVSAVLKAVKHSRPTIFPGTPVMYQRIAEYPAVRRYGVASIRICVSGGSPLPLEVQEIFEKITRGRVLEGYGLTEASPLTHANPLGVRRRDGSIGIPISNTEAKIVDTELGHTLPDGEIGELWVRGPQVMVGYWKDPTATALALRPEGWLATGDMAKRDEDGFFYIVDRKKDLILNGSLCVYPREIEELIYEHPAVAEVAIAAVPRQDEPSVGDNRTHDITAFVVANGHETVTAESLLQYCQLRLPPQLVPHQVKMLDELPRNFSGKVLRKQLISLVGLIKTKANI